MPNSYPANVERNDLIAQLLRDKRLSYAVIGEMMGVSRQVVAGVAFRQRHPHGARIGPGNKRTMTGTGWQPRSYWPEKTAQNTR